MKKLIIILTSLVLSITAVADNFTNKYPSEKLNFNKTTDETVMVDLNFDKPVTSFSISGTCKLDDANRALFRAILIDNTGKEYLVAEYIGYLEEKKNINFKNNCIETILLDNVTPSKLKLVISQSRVHITGIEYSSDMPLSEKELAKIARKSQHKDFADKYQRHNDIKGFPWIADTAGTTPLTYAEKRTMFGDGSDYFFTDGMEYYTGGFFVVSENMDPMPQYVPTNSKYVSDFDWTHRHGRNWITSVKSQIVPAQPDSVGNGGCWAFSATALAEAYINLYYNQTINLDLSEQHLISCSGAGFANAKSSKQYSSHGGSSSGALTYIINNGIINESCFPFVNWNAPCSNKCSSPEQLFKAQAKGYITFSEDNMKNALINKGPVISGYSTYYPMWESTSGHVMLLVGYGTLKAGDNVLYGESNLDVQEITVSQSSGLVGRTYWKFKNSYGTQKGRSGYYYVVFENPNRMYGADYISGVKSIIGYTESDRKCEDLDGDGYYNWGIGPKPAHCPNCPDLPDGNDYNPNVGGMNEYGVAADLSNPLAEPTISGPEAIGCSGTYKIMNVNDKVKITWSVKKDVQNRPLLFTGSSNDAMVKVKQGTAGAIIAQKPYVGSATLVAKLESDGVTKTIEKTIQVYGDVKPAISSPLTAGVADMNKKITFTEKNCNNIPAQYLKWTGRTPTAYLAPVTGQRSYSITPTKSGTYTISVINTLSCEHGDNIATYSFKVFNIIEMNFNNPASDVLNISITDSGDGENAPAKLMSNSTIVYTIEIWHELLGKVKSVETETTEVNINISDLPEGNYVIRLFKNGELETVSNLIIKR